MLKFLKNLFGMGPYSESRPADVVAPGAAPYKVPEPAATTPIPLVVEAAPVVAEKASVKAKAPAKAKAPTKPKAAAIKAPAKAPAKTKAPATKKPKISIAK